MKLIITSTERALDNVLEAKMRRIEADANDLLRYGHDEVRLHRILGDILELRDARDAWLKELA
jgi:uncharacterized membrane protein YccC